MENQKTSSGAVDRQELRDEISYLGRQLGQVVSTLEGEAALERIETIRQLAREYRQGNADARNELAEVIHGLQPEELRVVIRAFTIFLNLANLAEDRHRVRVLRLREANLEGSVKRESIRDAIRQLSEREPNALRDVLAELDVMLVLTAHPTEAKRRSIRGKLRKIRKQLVRRDGNLLPAEQHIIDQRIRNSLIKLWQSDLVRPARPTVMQEVERGLSIKPVLWELIPQVMRDLRDAVGEFGAKENYRYGPVLRYGSWMGGDRDGHPHVTVATTRETIQWLRTAAIEMHLEAAKELRGSLSLSHRQADAFAELQERLDERLVQWPLLREIVEKIPPSEVFRRWLCTIEHRLQETIQVGEPFRIAGYQDAGELEDDVEQICESLSPEIHELIIRYELQPWLDRIRTFGFHLAALDVRQDSGVHADTVNQILVAAGLVGNPTELDESARCELLARTLRLPLDWNETQLTPAARETLALFAWLRHAVGTYGYDALGGYIISMTRAASDMLSVLWLWHHAGREASSDNVPRCLPIIPLFETIADLQHADEVLNNTFRQPALREHVQAWQDELTVMLGYSDGTKDGGYLAASWALQDAQVRLQEAAAQEQVKLTFFHGRGGSLGRGGGPAARAILSLPPTSFQGRLRLTEQGEVLAERYDDPRIAYRHLEQVIWASLLAGGSPATPAPERWNEVMQRMAVDSRTAYRALVDQDDFVAFFRQTTPLNAIESLPIGSRPARRKATADLSGLRAIPWVFSWTQCRWLVPAWYGLGSAVMSLQSAMKDADERLQEMYREWSFFRATVDNAVLAVVKADVSIARLYGEIAADHPSVQAIVEQISEEYDRTYQSLLVITDSHQLMADTAWLRESIHVRNYYTDPLNMIQVELLKRKANTLEDQPTGGDGVNSLDHLIRLTINGIASGMRTTG